MIPHSPLRPASALALTALVLLGSTARAEDPPAAPPAEAAPAAPPADAASPAAAAAAASATPAAAAAAPATSAPAAEPPPPPPPPRSQADIDYDRARQLIGKKKYDDALSTLDHAADEAGAAPSMLNRIRILRAQILLAKKRPDVDAARALVLRVMHDDHEMSLFSDASDPVRAVANEFHEAHPFVMNDTLALVRSGRPLKLRAHVIDPGNTVTLVKVHYKAQDSSEYSDGKLVRDQHGFAFSLRDVDSLAPAGVTDDYTIEYYFTAHDSTGKVVDTNGTAAEPLGTMLNTAKAEAAEVAAGVDLNAVNKAQEHGPIIIPPPPPVTPWYLRWYTITGAGVIVAAAIVIPIVLNATRQPAAVPANLGEIKFPVMQ